MNHRFINSLWLFAALLVAYGCGGGGGGGGGVDTGLANLRIGIDPEVLDSGDEALVSVQVNDIQDRRIMLKVFLPAAVTYQRGTAYYNIDGKLKDAQPTRKQDSNSNTYLVFDEIDDLNPKKGSSLKVEFLVEGQTNDPDTSVQADIDLDDGEKFDVDSPKFDALAEDFFRVGPGPTPTPTA